MSFERPSGDLADRALSTMRALERARAERPIARASLIDRLFARAIDLVLVGLPLFLLLGVLPTTVSDDPGGADGRTNGPEEFVVGWGINGLSWELAGALAAFVAVACVYDVGVTAWRGATFGKRRASIRVVELDMRPVSPRLMLIRTLVWALPLCLAALMWFTSILLSWGPLVIVIAMWFAARRDPQARGIHDRLAGTTVVSEETWRQNVGTAERG